MTIKYSNTSPYFTTAQTSWYLANWNSRSIPKFSTDKSIILKARYRYRPDLLSFDLYGTTRLWWVFSVRNPDLIKDPIFDFIEGITIFVTEKDTLMSILNA